MPTAYIKSLVKKGKGTTKELEDKWKKAKKQAKKQDKDDNFAYITSIFNKMINEMFQFDANKLKSETPTSDFEQVGSDYDADKIFNDHVDNLKAGKYYFNCDDNNGHWKKGDVVEIPNALSPKKEVFGKKTYEITVNDINVYVHSGFLDPINEDGGVGFSVGANMSSTSDVVGYETPFSKNKTHKKGSPDLMFWKDEEEHAVNDEIDEDEIDEDGTDFSYAFSKIKDPKKKNELPVIDDDITKRLKIHSPELVKK